MNRPRVHLLGWQKVRWALDEDLLWARRSLDGFVAWTPFVFADVVHSAWWPALLTRPREAFRGKFVICFADNPPAFYLTQAGFERAAELVDLWVARSSEAAAQFGQLGLPVATVPYCVGRDVFRPLDRREEIRSELGIPSQAFVIGNFHRDSEGADLRRPKVQKGADLFLEIARRLHARRPETKVLLAGPRRHWLYRALIDAGVPVVFSGPVPGESDDFSSNVLPRAELNRLYQALDVCLISSRWEGGPYSVLEALAAGTPALATPVGTCRDVLPPEALFRSVDEAVEILACGVVSRVPYPATHSPEALSEAMRAIYSRLPLRRPTSGQVMRGLWSMKDCVRGTVDWSGTPHNASIRTSMRTAQRLEADNVGPIVFGPHSPVELCAAQILRARGRFHPPRIVGIVLVRNEDLHLGQALQNAQAFCDHWILADNGSTDGTRRILEEFSRSVPSAELHAIERASESQDLLRGLVGTNTWVFALDGDEVYDPRGLARFRERLRAGEACDAWMILGHVLHVSRLNGLEASGYATPPCRSMTKLYNFAAIDAWDGYSSERLHGGRVRFRTGFSDDRRWYLHDEELWAASDFRCLHLCFLPRSSQEDGGAYRPNLMDQQGATRLAHFRKAFCRALGSKSEDTWKKDRYRRGQLVTRPVKDFFATKSGC